LVTETIEKITLVYRKKFKLYLLILIVDNLLDRMDIL